METRPPTEPIAHLPRRRRPRHIEPHWTDKLPLITFTGAAVTVVIAASQGH